MGPIAHTKGLVSIANMGPKLFSGPPRGSFAVAGKGPAVRICYDEPRRC